MNTKLLTVAAVLASVFCAASSARAETEECKAVKHAYGLKRLDRMTELGAELNPVKWVLDASLNEGMQSRWVQTYRSQRANLKNLPDDRPDLIEPVTRDLQKRIYNSVRDAADPVFPQSVMIVPNKARSAAEAPEYYSQIVTDFSKLKTSPVVRFCVYYSYNAPVSAATTEKHPLACVDTDLVTGKIKGRNLADAIAIAFSQTESLSLSTKTQKGLAAELVEYHLTPQAWIASQMTDADREICKQDTTAATEDRSRDVKRVPGAAPAPGPEQTTKRPLGVHGIEETP